jgi:lipoprotein NlpI
MAFAVAGIWFAGCGGDEGVAPPSDRLGRRLSDEVVQPTLPGRVVPLSAEPTETIVKDVASQPTYPLPPESLAEIQQSLARSLQVLDQEIETDSDDAELFSRRGTAHFFVGQFEKAAADFDRELELEPARKGSHWRRGIALYFAGRYDESAEQFAEFHSQDTTSDRENGIWHFLANAARSGIDEAREKMLVYADDDRRPVMNRVYAMYAGKTTADEVLESIESADLDRTEREQQRFFAHAYAGWLAVAEQDLGQAKTHFEEAMTNEWGRQAVGGPGYMWHTARVHYDLLVRRQEGAIE